MPRDASSCAIPPFSTDPAAARNEGTIVDLSPDTPGRESPPLPRQAFLAAYERLSLLSQVATGPGFLVAAVDPTFQVTFSLVLADRKALILGRHSHCGGYIDDPAVALRQVAALVRSEAGCPLLHLRDLDTTRPMILEDGSESGGVVADGPVYIAVGRMAVWFLPVPLIRPSLNAVAAWAELKPRSIRDGRLPRRGPQGPGDEPGMPPSAAIPRSAETSSITRLPAPSYVTEDDAPDPWGILSVEGGAEPPGRAISGEQLADGILIGRYPRCAVQLDSPGHHLSRVHALLLRLDQEVWIIDTASQNGTRRGDATIQATVLHDTDTLNLARTHTLHWQRVVQV